MVAVKHAVELEDDVGGEGHVRRGFVNEIERITVTGDLLLGAISGGRRFEDQRLDALPRRRDALETVRRLRRLDHGGLAQRGQNVRGLLAEQVLPPPELAQSPEQSEAAVIESAESSN